MGNVMFVILAMLIVVTAVDLFGIMWLTKEMAAPTGQE